MKPHIIVWDSNPFNAYGAEVARVIALGGYRVLRYCRENTRFPSQGVRTISSLPRSGDAREKLAGRIRYALAILRMALRCLSTDCVLVLPWIGSPEKGTVAALQRLGVRTVVVAHNPIPARDEALSDSRVDHIRSRADRVIVHSERFRLGRYAGDKVQVAAHPGYFSWAAATCAVERRSAADKCRRVLYLGAARGDKGFDELPRIAERLLQFDASLTVAVGKIPREASDALMKHPNVELIGSEDSYLDDAQVRAAMESSDVLIAPYRSVTASGTILTALTVGLPIVCYEAEPLRALLPAEAFVPVGSWRELSESAATTPLPSADELIRVAQRVDAESVSGWASVLQSISAAKDDR